MDITKEGVALGFEPDFRVVLSASPGRPVLGAGNAGL